MNSHPQRTGRSLFLLWAAGLLVQAVLMRVVWIAATPAGSPLNSQVQIVSVAVAVAGHAWQAWLLFRPGWRFAVWAALPLISLVAPGSIRWIQLQGIIAPLVETAVVAGVRLRPWAWLLAGMGQVIVAQLGSMLVHNLAYSVGSRMLPPAALGIVAAGAVSGLWLLGELAAAAVLAWWMPPIQANKQPERGE